MFTKIQRFFLGFTDFSDLKYQKKVMMLQMVFDSTGLL